MITLRYTKLKIYIIYTQCIHAHGIFYLRIMFLVHNIIFIFRELKKNHTKISLNYGLHIYKIHILIKF